MRYNRIEDTGFERRYMYSHILNKGEQEFYRFVLERVIAREYKFLYTSEFMLKYIPKESLAYPTLIERDGEDAVWTGKAYSALLLDFPELFFIAPELDYSMDTYLMDIGMDYTDEQIEEIYRRLDELYHAFDGVPTGFELEVAVAEYIVKHFDYESDYKNFDGKAVIELHSVVGLLRDGRGVCDGISRLAQYVMQRRGMEVIMALSNPDFFGKPDEEAHAWLIVKLEGKYYHLDITDCESSSNDRDYIQKTLFNVTDSDMMQVNPHYYKEYYKDIVCNSRKYNYYHRMGLYYNTPEKIVNAICGQIAAQKDAGVEGRFCFKTPKRFTINTVRPILQAAVNQSPVKVELYHTSDNGYHIVGFTYL